MSTFGNKPPQSPRILGGERRGLLLQTPRGATTRPVAARARKSLFDKIQHGKNFRANTFVASANNDDKELQEPPWLLDVFAGSGALGIEALSRWRGRAAFFENDHSATRALRNNLHASRLQGKIHHSDALDPPSCAQGERARVTLAFFAPPYSMKEAEQVPAIFASKGWFKDEALIIFQCAPIKAKVKVKRMTAEEQPRLGSVFTLEDYLPCSSACFFFFRYRGLQ